MVLLETHDPTQGMRQGNDIGTQYRSAIFTTTPEQSETAHAVERAFEPAVKEAGLGPITTSIQAAGPYWLAEDYHQQYLFHNPNGVLQPRAQRPVLPDRGPPGASGRKAPERRVRGLAVPARRSKGP
jgi:peptide methionine sulfoxide reductase MsrA